ncbi:MAG: hypothetical protein ACR2G5_18635 [Pyrinomonadaceae bacterium]
MSAVPFAACLGTRICGGGVDGKDDNLVDDVIESRWSIVSSIPLAAAISLVGKEQVVADEAQIRALIDDRVKAVRTKDVMSITRCLST